MADIDTLTIHVEDGIKTGDYAPNKQYSFTANLSYPDEASIERAVAILKRRGDAFLGRPTAPAAPAPETHSPDTSSGSQASAGSENAGEPQRRTRRTKEQIAADAAAAAAAQSPPAPQEPAPSAETHDEWDVGEETVTITDKELNDSCSDAARRVGDANKVKAVIQLFNPGGDAFDTTKPGGRKFTVNDVPQNQRADFVAKLKALS